MQDTLSVRDVLAMAELHGAEVLAGHAGLDRRVRTVNVMEVPDILPWVHADELLLTTAYPLRQHPEWLGELVRQLDERGLAGIFLKPERYLEGVPAPMVEEADQVGFPLVRLPAEAAFSDIINATLTVLLNAQADRLKRAQDIRDRFNEIVLTGGGFVEIARALAEALNRPVVVVDADDHARGAAGDTALDDVPTLAQALGDGGDDIDDGAHLRIGELILQPIRANGHLLGGIFTTADPGELTDDGREALQYAATVSALHQVQAQAFAAEEDRSQAIYLEQLVNAESDDWAALLERAAAFGWDLRRQRAALVVVLEGGTPPPVKPRRPLHRLSEAIRASSDPEALVWERSSEVAVLLPIEAATPDATRRAVDGLRRSVSARLPGASLTMGYGRAATTPDQLPRSFAEARRALTVGRWGGSIGEVHGYVELGVERLLAELDDGELTHYRDELIGPLLQHDNEAGSDLVTSLETYLSTRNIAESARRLYVHHNTMRNQLQRIEDILGPFLDDGERCLSLALAIRVHRFTQIRSSSG